MFRITSRQLHQSSDILQVGDEVNRAKQHLDRSSSSPAVLELTGQVIDTTNNAIESIKPIAESLKPLVDKLEIFVKAVDKLAEVITPTFAFIVVTFLLSRCIPMPN
jgi:hypothetical protein